MPFIIGTAGHIDHGKTSLVKALTGQDTDRLKEEKERGISIDLGFARLDLPDGTRAGVVDVPGHERFIRNMLAGAHGIDLVLFTVAADDGVMPQTEEHLDILHLLGVRRAIFVITKVDLAPEARIRDVEDEVRILAAGTALEHAPMVRFSCITGEGLDAIRALVAATLQQADKPRSPGCFRLPVDRVFVLQGHGLVVTGTATSGAVKVGDRLRCLPGQQTFRVRNVHVHNEPVELAVEGQRIALNLTGPDTPSLERGHVICDEELTLGSERFDAWLELRPGATEGLKNHQRVRVHLGTAERLGRVLLLASMDRLGPKQSTYCQVSVTEPLHVMRGDHFILRNETAQRTLGGGIVVHPWATKHRHRDADLLHALDLLHRGGPEQVVEAFVEHDDEFALPADRLAQFLNLPEAQVRARVAPMGSIRALTLEGETLYASATKWRQASEALIGTLRRFHAARPLAPGMDIEAARDTMPFQMTPKRFRAFVEGMEEDGAIVREASLLRLPSHTVRLHDEERALVERIRALLGANPVAPPDLAEIERSLGIGRTTLGEVLRVMERERLIVRVSPDLCFLTESVERAGRMLKEHWGEHDEITPAAFRDVVGTTRKFALPLLQYFDRSGITVRIGETRRLRNASPIRAARVEPV